MKKITLLCVALSFFAVISCNEPIRPDNPWGTDRPGGSTSDPTDTVSTQPTTPDTPDVPETPGEPDNPDVPSDDTYSGTVTPYDGEWASDASNDVVDLANPDIYWEATENDFSNVVTVTFDGTVAKINNKNSKIVTYTDGAFAVVDFLTNSVAGVNVVVQGITSDGGLKIYGDKKHMITLNGCDITSKTGPAINDQCHKRVFVHAMPGTTNRLTDATSYLADKYYIDGASSTTEDSKACFFSEGNMIFSGTGALVVSGNHNHSIASDGFAWVRPGVTMSLATKANDCFHANGDADDNLGIYVAGGYMKATNSAAAGKCINCDLDVTIGGGKLDLSTSGGVVVENNDASSSMCIKSDLNVFLVAGDITCSSTGQAGKGVKAGNDSQKGNLVIGTTDGNGPKLKVSTTGSAYGSSGGGPGGGGPGGGWGGGGWGGSSSSASSKPKAMKATGYVYVYGGDLEITTTQSEGEGIESKTASTNSIVLKGGNLYLKCADDCINSPGQIVVEGSNIFAWSTGNDAIDSNYGKSNSILIKDGIVIAHAASSPEEALDCDNDAYVTINGGVVFTSGGQQGGGGGWGGSSSSSTPSHTQPIAKLSGKSVSTGYFVVTDSAGEMVMCCYVPRSISQNYSYLSCPNFKSGSSYKYGIITSAPKNATSSWSTYFYCGGTESVSTGSINPS